MGLSTRVSRGCWTCKVRHKKCDGDFPACNACSALQLTCHYEQGKPEWMDGGSRQKKMADSLKIKVKENAHRRRAERAVATSGNSSSTLEPPRPNGEWIVLSSQMDRPGPLDHDDFIQAEAVTLSTAATPENINEGSCSNAGALDSDKVSFPRADTTLIAFHLENLFPLLLPFYQPSFQQGGKAWMLELMLKSTVVRQATLCQSSYYLSLAHGTRDQDGAWNRVLAQTADAFGVLGRALKYMDGSAITEHMHGAVRVLTSMIQLQRFEVAVMSFSNCQAHLQAGVSLFRQLLDNAGTTQEACARSRFDAVIGHLGSSPGTSSRQNGCTQTAEQAAFRFSSALWIFDDIIASTALQQQPRLYDLHEDLLGSNTAVDLQAVVGCENCILLHIGRVSALDAWKQQCKEAGNFDIVQLVERALPIKEMIENDLLRVYTNSSMLDRSNEDNSLIDALAPIGSSTLASQSSLVTRMWAHGAILYLTVVVSGLQPASTEARSHVRKIIDLLPQISPPALLRTVSWPLCIAGCLAEAENEARFREIVQTLQPSSLFGTLYKALEIMETVWSNRHSSPSANLDFAACLRSQDNIVLLV